MTDQAEIDDLAARDRAIGAFIGFERDPRPNRAPDGPLAGLRLAVKDLVAVAGLPQTAGLPLWRDRRATVDAPLVTDFERAGARLVGVTTTDSAGFGTMTPEVAHPLRPGYAVGGSSGGSAAALAAEMADIGIGTDTGGSVRIPPACCGLFGFKPSFGRAPVEEIIPLAPTFDHPGVMTRDAETLARAAAVLIGADIRLDAPEPVRRVGIDARRLDFATALVRDAFGEVLRRVSAAGGEIVLVGLGDREILAKAHGVVTCREGYEAHRDHWTPDGEGFTEVAHEGITAGSRIGPARLAEARRTVEAARRTIAAAFARAELVLAPTLPMAPPPRHARQVLIGARTESITIANISENVPFNVLGNPVVALPVPVPGFPLGFSVQVAAPPGADERLFAHLAALLPVLRGSVRQRTGAGG